MASNKGRRGQHSHGRRNDKSKLCLGESGREVLGNISENSPVIASFRQYAAELDDKNDRYERVIKLSRDITIESKRIIFLLHTLDREEKREGVLKEAEERLNSLCRTHFRSIAKELQGLDPYQYIRAYTAGLQEFIEALTFHQYLRDGIFEDWTKVQSRLSYTQDEINKLDHVPPKKHYGRLPKVDTKPEIEIVQDNPEITTKTEGGTKPKIITKTDAGTNSEITTVATTTDSLPSSPQIEDNSGDVIKPNGDNVEGENVLLERNILAFVPPSDFILGVGDLTGEIMRKCINSLGAGDIDACFEACQFVRDVNKGFFSIPPGGSKEISRKAYTLRQSTLKVETVCYNIRVRGGESSAWGLADATCAGANVDDAEDEGFY